MFAACVAPSSPSIPNSLCAQSPPAPRSPSNLFVTFKVAQLVNAFRKRVKTRVHSRVTAGKTPAGVQEDFCQEYERQALVEIDKCLGHKDVHANAKRIPGAKRFKPRKSTRTTVEPAASNDKPSTESWRASFQSLLNQIDAQRWLNEQSITKVAKDDKLFFERGCKLDLNHLSTRELPTILALVQRLLASIAFAHQHCFRDGYSICEGREIVRDGFDETFLANLEHCLLCNQTELLLALFSLGWLLIQKHLIECQREQSRKSDDFFFEFPDARHPLSTTWPWSIRPSLAVIWGVCWMFYTLDSHGNFVDETGRIIMPHAMFPYDDRTGTTLAPSDAPRPLAYGVTSAEFGATQPRNNAYLIGGSNDAYSQTPAVSGSAGPGTYTGAVTTTAAVPASGEASSGINQGLHTEAFDTDADFDEIDWYDGISPQVYTANYDTTGADLPQRQRVNSMTPGIRLITTGLPTSTSIHIGSGVNQADFDSRQQQLPQHISPHISPRSLDHTEPLLSPVSGYYASRNIYYTNMPPSPSGEDGLTSPLPRRSRGYSESNNSQSPLSPYERHVSPNSTSSRSVPPRPEPILDDEKKYICTYHADCKALRFDRKCEWSKHMDKHDRPYRCSDPGCAKLQGFTYSGGLLRHEREVHKKHGGPKDQLFCPHALCKRNRGHGFTRKENLNEHIRRVHDKTAQTPVKTEDDGEDNANANDAETPHSEHSETAGASGLSSNKRKRDSIHSDRSEGADKEELISKLMSKNKEWEDRVIRMEREMAELKGMMKR